MDYYQVLGISRESSEKDVKAAFRKLALKYHPDRQSGASLDAKAEAAKRFKAATEAYETLVDGKRRQSYNFRDKSATSSQPRYRQYSPHAYSYQSYTPQSNQRGRMFSFFSIFLKGMTRTDGIFHAAMAGMLIFGAILAGGVGDILWSRWNRGRLFEHLEAVERRPTTRVRLEAGILGQAEGQPGRGPAQKASLAAGSTQGPRERTDASNEAEHITPRAGSPAGRASARHVDMHKAATDATASRPSQASATTAPAEGTPSERGALASGAEDLAVRPAKPAAVTLGASQLSRRPEGVGGSEPVAHEGRTTEPAGESEILPDAEPAFRQPSCERE